MKTSIPILLVVSLVMQGCGSGINVYSKLLHIGNVALEKLGWQARMVSSYDYKGADDDEFLGINSQLMVENGNMESYRSILAGWPDSFKKFIYASEEYVTNNTIVADYKSVAFYYFKNQ
ncbi:hypothetical protein [Carboxylicivirga taeanensis]|uniref:hypothetical protein n=1 Tax=Carboxylicivirga taeanensis TaxID=1416875 RepID=UPI003F6DE096